METKQDRVVGELLDEIASGRYGSFGNAFMTTRDLAAYKKISLKTAFSILNRLRETGVLEKSEQKIEFPERQCGIRCRFRNLEFKRVPFPLLVHPEVDVFQVDARCVGRLFGGDDMHVVAACCEMVCLDRQRALGAACLSVVQYAIYYCHRCKYLRV